MPASDPKQYTIYIYILYIYTIYIVPLGAQFLTAAWACLHAPPGNVLPIRELRLAWQLIMKLPFDVQTALRCDASIDERMCGAGPPRGVVPPSRSWLRRCRRMLLVFQRGDHAAVCPPPGLTAMQVPSMVPNTGCGTYLLDNESKGSEALFFSGGVESKEDDGKYAQPLLQRAGVGVPLNTSCQMFGASTKSSPNEKTSNNVTSTSIETEPNESWRPTVECDESALQSELLATLDIGIQCHIVDSRDVARCQRLIAAVKERNALIANLRSSGLVEASSIIESHAISPPSPNETPSSKVAATSI